MLCCYHLLGERGAVCFYRRCSRGGRGRGGTVGARAQKTGRVTAAALREMEKEKEEAERQRLLDAFDEGGRLDPIPNGVRIEAKWLDDQFRMSAAIVLSTPPPLLALIAM